MANIVLLMLLLQLGGGGQDAVANAIADDPFRDHPCGSPVMVSSTYRLSKGSNIEVVDVETMVLDLDDPIDLGHPSLGRLLVRLVAVAQPTSRELLGSCKSALVELIEGEEVDVLFNGSALPAPGVPVIIQSGETEINRWLLATGCARFETKEDYEVNWWVACDYQRAQEEAREAGLGIWSQSRVRRGN